jgi:hypothetical protein
VGRFGQFKAHYDAQAIPKHIIKIFKKIQFTFNLIVISKLFRGHHATSQLCP